VSGESLAARLNRGLGKIPGQPLFQGDDLAKKKTGTDAGLVWFRPRISLAHMATGGRHRFSKRFAVELVPNNLGEILVVADAGPVVAGGGGAVDTEWMLDTPPQEYIERYADRYESGDVSDTVRQRYELALSLVAEG
jgi:hypothetical protein